MPSESSPLLPGQSRGNDLPGKQNRRSSAGHPTRIPNGGNSTGNVVEEPLKTFRPLQSSRYILFRSWLNILLLTVPVALACHFVKWPATVKFIISFLSIIPLAALLGDATEQVSMSLGQTLGGLLNATFGNAVELIVGVVALSQNQLRLVQTSMLGSILSNILLVLGCSFAAGGIVFKESTFQTTAAQTSSGVLTLACAALVIPAAYHSTYSRSSGSASPSPKDLVTALQSLVLGNSSAPSTTEMISALAMITRDDGDDAPDPHDESLSGLLVLSRGTSIILLVVYIAYLYFQLKSHSNLFEAEADENGESEEEHPEMDTYSAAGWLVIITVVTAFCADVLVSSIDETASKWKLPKPFIGLILLPIVGNAAEHVTAVWMAMKGRTELTIGVAVGSSIQIAAGMIPILVLVSWALHKNLTLFFADFETIVLFIAVVLVNILLQDGRSNYIEGIMLIALYLVIALSYLAA